MSRVHTDTASRVEVPRDGLSRAFSLQQIGACLVHAPIMGAKSAAKRLRVQWKTRAK